MSDTAVLFDLPGPRGRRRIAVATAIAIVLLGGLTVLALWQFAAHGALDRAKWQIFLAPSILRYLGQGLLGTAEAAAVAGVLALPLGALLAIGRLARRRVIRLGCGAYIETFRSLPVLLLLYLFLLGLPSVGLTLPIFWQLVVPIVLTMSASIAEVFRAGVLALPPGQSEAAFALGLGYWQTQRFVVIPQVVRLVLPALITQSVSLVKETTLGYVVSYAELLQSGKVLGEYTHTLVQTYLVVAMVYVLVNLSLSKLARSLEHRNATASARRRGRFRLIAKRRSAPDAYRPPRDAPHGTARHRNPPGRTG